LKNFVANVESFQDNDKLVTRCLKSCISAKQFGYEDLFTALVTRACVSVTPENARRFNVDNVRVCKILGGNISDAYFIPGAVISRNAEGTIKYVSYAKVAVYTHGFDAAKTDLKGTVNITSGAELEAYSKTEEDKMEEKVKAIANAGISLVVCGGTIGEMAMHFFERYKIMVLKTVSKFELRRICYATGARGLLSLACPVPEETGFISECKVQEIGSNTVTVLTQEGISMRSNLATIVVRAATPSIMDDIERAINDGVNVYKAITKDGKFLPGAGATEIELAKRIQAIGEGVHGQDQYAIKKYAEAFEVIPRIIAENAGLDATEMVATLYAEHEKGNSHGGVNIIDGGVLDATEQASLTTSKQNRWPSHLPLTQQLPSFASVKS